MVDILQAFGFSSLDWILILMAGLLIGMSKTGVNGVNMIAIPIVAAMTGGMKSAGIILPLLIVGDMFGVFFYHRHARWKYIIRLFPWTIVGLGIGLIVGKYISDHQFKQLVAIIVIISLGIMVYREYTKKQNSIPEHWLFAAVLGLAGGFTTMIGNAAGPVMALYLLAMKLPKNNFIGTAAWFFAIINIIKLPLHIFLWQSITLKTITLDLALVPMLAIGALSGFRIIKLFPEKPFRIFIIVVTAIAAVKLLLI